MERTACDLDISQLADVAKQFDAATVCEGAIRMESGINSERGLPTFMLEVARRLGSRSCGSTGRASLDRLVPKGRNAARRNTLSMMFGMGAFPMHTDLAHWVTPARYIILAAEFADPNSAATNIVPVPRIDHPTLSVIESGVFLIRNGSRSFLGSICSAGRRFYRFDPVCMKPIDSVSDVAGRAVKDPLFKTKPPAGP